MNDTHLTPDELELFAENEMDARTRVEIEKHVSECAMCRGNLEREQSLSRALRVLPRREPPHDLSARIGSAVQIHRVQEKLRRARMPFILVATGFSLLLLAWFTFQLVIALEDNGTLYLVSLLTSRPDVISAFAVDAVWAVIEALPLGEIVLTLFALFTVIVLAQQWIETVRPHTSYS